MTRPIRKRFSQTHGLPDKVGLELDTQEPKFLINAYTPKQKVMNGVRIYIIVRYTNYILLKSPNVNKDFKNLINNFV